MKSDIQLLVDHVVNTSGTAAVYDPEEIIKDLAEHLTGTLPVDVSSAEFTFSKSRLYIEVPILWTKASLTAPSRTQVMTQLVKFGKAYLGIKVSNSALVYAEGSSSIVIPIIPKTDYVMQLGWGA